VARGLQLWDLQEQRDHLVALGLDWRRDAAGKKRRKGGRRLIRLLPSDL